MALPIILGVEDEADVRGDLERDLAKRYSADYQVLTSDSHQGGLEVLSAAQRRYVAGSADFLVVTDAQRALYAARDQLIDIRRARLAASVALFKALGGGFVSQTPPSQ